jgi:hypothetical protein
MPIFRVKIEKPVQSSRMRNPFRPISMNSKINTYVRVWEFEAKDEAEVRMYFEEAKKADLPNVKGYELKSIEQIKE